jgi:cytochrome P450
VQVSLVLGSANHDETIFDDPDRYDLFARRAPHLAFAEGPHRCLGEHLARLETTVAMNVILDRLRDVRLGAGDAYIRGDAFRSPNALPVLFKAS